MSKKWQHIKKPTNRQTDKPTIRALERDAQFTWSTCTAWRGVSYLVFTLIWCSSPEFLLVLSVRRIRSLPIPPISLLMLISLVSVSIPPVVPSISRVLGIAIAFVTSTLTTRGRRTRPLTVSSLVSIARFVVVAFTVAVVDSLAVRGPGSTTRRIRRRRRVVVSPRRRRGFACPLPGQVTYYL